MGRGIKERVRVCESVCACVQELGGVQRRGRRLPGHHPGLPVLTHKHIRANTFTHHTHTHEQNTQLHRTHISTKNAHKGTLHTLSPEAASAVEEGLHLGAHHAEAGGEAKQDAVGLRELERSKACVCVCVYVCVCR